MECIHQMQRIDCDFSLTLDFGFGLTKYINMGNTADGVWPGLFLVCTDRFQVHRYVDLAPLPPSPPTPQ